MDPRIYVPAYLERLYIQEHPGLTEGVRELVREQIAAEPERYAANVHAQALLSYSRVHGELTDGLLRMEGLPDDEFERGRGELFSQAREQLANIIAEDPTCLDARLVSIQLAEVPLDACLSDMLKLEREAREMIISTHPGFDPDVDGLWAPEALADGTSASELTASDPDLIGLLHILEALAQGSIFTARYRSAANYARTVMRAKGFPNYAAGTLLLALARLEDEDAFFQAVQEAGPDVEDLRPRPHVAALQARSDPQRSSRPQGFRHALRWRRLLPAEPHLSRPVPARAAARARDVGSCPPGRVGGRRHHRRHARLHPMGGRRRRRARRSRRLRLPLWLLDRKRMIGLPRDHRP